MAQLRAFIAVALSAELRAGLRRVQRQLQDADAAQSVRWVAPANIHLTLKFLGAVESTRLAQIESALRQAAAASAPFTLCARGIGCFPNARRPNNVWVGIEGDVASVRALAERIEEACAALGIPREGRPFAPHLTLGRIPRDAQPAARAALGALLQKLPAPDLGVIPVDTVHLITSALRPTGPIYTTLATVALAQNYAVPRPP